jgi:hypothetical protein
MQRDTKSRPVHENLDTAYVNLAALLRYLQQREFAGRVHVELDEYEADIFLNAQEAPRVRETDHATGRTGEGEPALQRLLVRATMPGGLISVYEGEDEESVDAATVGAASETLGEDETFVGGGPEDAGWRELLSLSGELIAAIERAAQNTGADFASAFRTVRLELADDYPFLDPSTKQFEYASGKARLQRPPAPKVYVACISECLHRVVDRVARGPRASSTRERVALELAIMARRRQSALDRFKLITQLDRIAGTRVL